LLEKTQISLVELLLYLRHLSIPMLVFSQNIVLDIQGLLVVEFLLPKALVELSLLLHLASLILQPHFNVSRLVSPFPLTLEVVMLEFEIVLPVGLILHLVPFVVELVF
jgi:hypothetical protein